MTGPASASSLVDQVVSAITTVVGPGPVPLHAPRFAGREWAYLKDCLDTTYVSSVGAYVDRFEVDLATYTGARHAVAVVNGTAALHMALRLVGVGPNDEVLVPALTFIATANAVSYCGAVPHFVECDARTLGVDPQALRAYLDDATTIRDGYCINRVTGRTIRAVVPMHTFGHPVDIDALQEVASAFHLVIVEDAAESLGSTRGGRHTGTWGLIGTLSFNGNKTLTTGGGGAIVTNDTRLAKLAKHLTTTARVAHQWEFTHDEIGFNYRMPNINAALGCAQLEQLSGILVEKRELYRRYHAAFASVPHAEIVAEPDGCRSNYWLQTLVLDEAAAVHRDDILAATNAKGLMTRPVWTLMHRLPMYAQCPRMELPVAESLERRLINLPSSTYAVTEPGVGR